jgi:Rad3-related DNA helicase
MCRHKRLFVEPSGGANGAQQFADLMDGYGRAATVGPGALLFAVFRGRASEGMDFSDERARAVMCLGIPYPGSREPSVELKREYNTQSGKTLSGSAWYSLQAVRAVNQAVGRCVRHARDYGAVIILDSRFDANTLPRWMRVAVQKVDARTCAANLSAFFRRQELFG